MIGWSPKAEVGAPSVSENRRKKISFGSDIMVTRWGEAREKKDGIILDK